MICTKQKHPNNLVLYNTYRRTFETNYNISFGYPRLNNCSHCDDLKVKIELLQNSDCENNIHNVEITKINRELELYQRKTSVFYDSKKKSNIDVKNLLQTKQ